MIITTTQEHVEVPGGKAERPTEIPARGWIQVAKRGWKEAKADQVPLLAAGVAFYAFLAIFPGLIAVVSIYGLFADPATITNQLNSLTAALPDQARQVITDQLTALTTRGRQTLGIGLILSVVIALWSASAGISIPAHGDQYRLRRGREARLRQEAAAVAGAYPRRHCLHGDRASCSDSSPCCRRC